MIMCIMCMLFVWCERKFSAKKNNPQPKQNDYPKLNFKGAQNFTRVFCIKELSVSMGRKCTHVFYRTILAHRASLT